MNDMTDLTSFDWAALWEMVKTTGVDFGLQVLIALIIFFVGRIVARMVQRGLRKVMQAREVDKILEDHRVEFDPAKRKQLLDRFQEIVHEEQPYAFLFMQNAITAWDRRFESVNWYPSGSTDLHLRRSAHPTIQLALMSRRAVQPDPRRDENLLIFVARRTHPTTGGGTNSTRKFQEFFALR